MTSWTTLLPVLTSKSPALDINTSFISPLNTAQCTVFSFVLAVSAVSFPPGSVPRLGLLFLNIAFTFQAFISPPPDDVDNPAVLYTSGVLIGNLTARYLDRLYLHTPEKDFHHTAGKDGVREQPNALPWWRKFLWSFELFTVTRGLGWNWQAARIPPRPQQSRFQFIVQRLFKYVVMYFGLYMTAVICRGVLDGFPNVQDAQLRKMLLLLTRNALFLHALIVLGWAMTIYSHFGLLMLPLSVICVGLRVGPRSWQDPEGWPPNFGSLKEAYSIRRFWGTSWHQQLRRITSTPGAKLLSLTPASFQDSKSAWARLPRRYFLILSSFIISGAIHTVGSYNVTRSLGIPLSDGGEFAYYLAQGVAIIVEDFALWLLDIDDQRRPPSTLRSTIGYAVTAFWYAWSRVALKSLPVTTAHGIRDERGQLYVAARLIELSALAVPGNFVAAAIRNLVG